MTFDRYLPIPFRSQGRDYSGCDCWGLLWLIYRDVLGVELETYAETPATSLRDVARLIERHKREFGHAVEMPQPLDAVVMRVRNEDCPGLAAHVGVMIDARRLIHTRKGIGVRVTRLDDPFEAKRIVEFRRHERCL